MTKLITLVLALGLAAGCHRGDKTSDKLADDVVAKQNDLDKQMDKNADRDNATRHKAAELEHATVAFNMRKEVRLIGLRAEHSMVAPQGEMIESLSAQLPLTDDARKMIDAKVDTLNQRAGDVAVKISDLQNATPDEWTSRDDAAGEAMKNLESARDDAWKAFKQAKRAEHRAS